MNHRLCWGLAVLIILIGGLVSYVLIDNAKFKTKFNTQFNANFNKSIEKLDTFNAELLSKRNNEEVIKEKRKQVLKPHRILSGETNGRHLLGQAHLVRPKLPNIDVNGVYTTVPLTAQGLFDEIEENHQVEDSPFGYGRYPTIHSDFPFKVGRNNLLSMLPEDIRYQGELVDRVLKTLYADGDKEVIGAKWHNGKVYPMYKDTFYVRQTKTNTFKETFSIEGEKVELEMTGGTVRIFGPGHSKLSLEIHNALSQNKPLPTGVKILDMDKHGIDPYEFLGIDRK